MVLALQWLASPFRKFLYSFKNLAFEITLPRVVLFLIDWPRHPSIAAPPSLKNIVISGVETTKSPSTNKLIELEKNKHLRLESLLTILCGSNSLG